MALPRAKKGRTSWKVLAYDHLVAPFTQRGVPISQMAMGAALGVGIGLTPTVGLQLYLISMIWLIARHGLGLRFNLPLALGLCWVSNPLTVLPLYFVFLHTGEVLLSYFGDYHTPSWGELKAVLLDPLPASESWWGAIEARFLGLFWLLGWPFVLGSAVWALGGGIITYLGVALGLWRYRSARQTASAAVQGQRATE